jgi:lysophospholipase L1-like esterase
MRVLSTTIKHHLINSLILLTSAVLSILAAELLARMVFNPMDYLQPTLVDDEFLGYRIEGYTGGYDEWGFRNARRPETSDIVCIGDSMTYGFAARARESWPAVLERMGAGTVYNMGVGGYGPVQYLYLLRTKAIKLHPKIIIVGFYIGNDLWDVYNAVRYNKNWSAYGKFGGSGLKAPAFVFPRQSGKFLKGLRDWLSENSVLYVVVTQLEVFDFVRSHEGAVWMADEASNLLTYRDDNHNVLFNLSAQIRFLDMRDPRITAATDITKRLMSDMQSVTEKRGIRLIVLIIPTKERVYSDILRRSGYVEKHLSLREALEQEDVARAAIIELLRAQNIEVLDPLPALAAAVHKRDLYPSYPSADIHPNKDGYRVIAETINQYLNMPHRQ